MSSLTVALDSDPSTPALEAPAENPSIAVGSGYGESKWVSEQILLRAARAVPDLSVSIVRAGQICGSAHGTWDIAHWAPALMVSGPILRCLPTLKGVSDVCLMIV
jgi:thioester reductase-like protein